jgi:hypothetical protein
VTLEHSNNMEGAMACWREALVALGNSQPQRLMRCGNTLKRNF